jgi:hypothetical protein
VRPIAVFLLAALACGKGVQTPGARLLRPAALATFRGVTAKRAGIAPYLAVASARGDELRLIDLEDETAVLAPVPYLPVSVPTGSRPSRLAAASLGDGLADALVAIPGGTAELQLVETWTAQNRIAPGQTLDLAALVPDVEILSLLGAPALAETPPGSGTFAEVPGEARFILGLSGGRIAVVTVSRGTGGEVAFGPDAPAVQDLAPLLGLGAGIDPFDVVALALAPDRRHVYGATPDAMGATAGVGGTLGAVEIDAAQPAPGSWTARALSAGAPTTVVAAFDVYERDPSPTAVNYPDSFLTTAKLRVYAALDLTACGRDQPISCGIVVIDPVAGTLAPDPAGEMPSLAPIPFPGVALAMAASGPPANGPTGYNQPRLAYVDAGGTSIDLLRMAPLTGGLYTGAMAVLATTDGHATWIDLSRWRTPDNVSTLRPASRTTTSLPGVAASLFQSYPGFTVNGTVVEQAGAFLGVCEYDAASCEFAESKVVDISKTQDPTQPITYATIAAKRIRLTPGYTPGDTWAVRYKAPIPGLGARRGVVGRLADGRLYAAIQLPNLADAPAGSPAFLGVARLYSPSFGIRSVATHGDAVADGVEVVLDDDTLCSVTATATPHFVAKAQDLVPPDPALFPGGAVILGEPFTSPDAGSCVAGGSVAGIAPGQAFPATVTVRASGLALYHGVTLLTGDYSVGEFAGRPEIGVPFALSYVREDTLSCPLIPWQDSLPYCDAACRAQCEALLQSRLARRIYYLDTICPAPACDPSTPFQSFCYAVTRDVTTGEVISTDPCLSWGFADVSKGGHLQYPFPTGPALGFLIATVPGVRTTGATQTYEYELEQGAWMEFGTSSGMAPAYRSPTTSGVVVGAEMPDDVVAFDRSSIPAKASEGVRFYVSYPDNEVLGFSPSASASATILIR